MKILITSGGTREPIDGVRFITNFSTGKTGAFLADYLAGHGHEVTYLHGVGAAQPRSGQGIGLAQARAPHGTEPGRALVSSRQMVFDSFQELDESLRRLLGEEVFDAVIHAAAVSDYSVAGVQIGSQVFEPGTLGKIDSSEPVQIRLKSNFKIIDRIKSYSKNPVLVVIGFKLTRTQDLDQRRQAALKLSTKSSVDYVVHNDLSEITDDRHVTRIYQRDHVVFQGDTKLELAENLDELLRGRA